MAKEKISKKLFYEEVKRIYCTYGKCNRKTYDKYTKYKNSNFLWYCHRFGGIKNILTELNLEFNGCTQISKSEIKEKTLYLYKKYGYINKELCIENKIHSTVVRKNFGSYNNLFTEINAPINMYKNVNKEDILQDVLEIYNKFNTTSSNVYRKYGKYSQPIIDRLFRGWECLISELNLTTASNSSAETLIEKWLQTNNIYFKKHYNFDWLRSPDGYKMYVDFYIPDKNIVIEYDGEQHFKFVKYFHKTEAGFEKQKNRDKTKQKLLCENNINVYHILFNQDILEELNNIF